MRVRVLIAVALVMLVAGLALWWSSASSPAPAPAPAVVGPTPAPAPAPPVAVAPAPVERARQPVARPAPASPAPAPAAAPVETAPTTATLRVETDVDNATVFIDRVGVGAAPLTIPNLQPGSHRVNVSAPGYEGYAETLDLEPGTRTLTVNFKVIRLDAKIPVTHKHGMGSCKGDLVASPDGLRYEAADGKDSVVVPFADVAAFDLDYLAKNLRLRTRQGKTLNFTDTDADRLFAFHRDVDKVRKRLATQ